MKEDEGAVKRLREEMAAVEFSSGLAIENPGMYTIDELRELIERNDKTAREIDELIRKDFEAMPPEMQKAMREMLSGSDVPNGIWDEILGKEQGDQPDAD